MKDVRFIEIPSPSKGNGLRYGDAVLALINEIRADLHELDLATFKQYGHDVKGLEKTSLFTSMEQLMNDKTYHVTLMLVRGEPAAVAMVAPEGKFVGFWNYGVTKKFRRQGYGKQLLRYVMDKHRKRGCTELALVVHADNMAASMMYLEAGFKIKSATMSVKL